MKRSVTIKLWVDDERAAPVGWMGAKTAASAIMVLDWGTPVEEISLDHDLGDTVYHPEQTGYTVLRHIEDRVAADPEYVPPSIKIHTANCGARPKMEAAVESINRFIARRPSKN